MLLGRPVGLLHGDYASFGRPVATVIGRVDR